MRFLRLSGKAERKKVGLNVKPTIPQYTAITAAPRIRLRLRLRQLLHCVPKNSPLLKFKNIMMTFMVVLNFLSSVFRKNFFIFFAAIIRRFFRGGVAARLVCLRAGDLFGLPRLSGRKKTPRPRRFFEEAGFSIFAVCFGLLFSGFPPASR